MLMNLYELIVTIFFLPNGTKNGNEYQIVFNISNPAETSQLSEKGFVSTRVSNCTECISCVVSGTASMTLAT